MRILFFSNVYPNPVKPGIGTFNRSLVGALAVEHEVQVVVPVPWADELRSRLRGGPFNTSRVQVTDGIVAAFPRYYYLPKVGRSLFGECMWRSAGPTLCRTIQEFQPDVIVSYWVYPDGGVAVRASQQFGIPSVVMVGGSDVLLQTTAPARRKVVCEILRQADAVVPVSGNIARRLIEIGVAEEKLHVIHRGIDANVFSPGSRSAARTRLGIDQSSKTMVAVGRLVPVKGFTHLIEACRQLKARQADFACYVLGDGPLRGRLEKQVRQSGLSGTVRLVGSQRQAELADWYRAADLVVLPSLSEGIPNVLLEAMACGARFVASEVGGVPEIFDPTIDRLVAAEQPQELSRVIAEQLAGEGEIVRQRFVPMPWSVSAQRLVAVARSCRTSTQQPIDKAKSETPVLQPGLNGSSNHEICESICT